LQVTTYDGGQEIGKITKQWAGFVREYFTSADQFRVSCKRFCVSVRDRVQALADISRPALCCHSNETRASIASLPNTAQLKGTPTIPQVTSGSVQWCGNAARDKQTERERERERERDRERETPVTKTNIHFASSTTHLKCNKKASIR